MYRSFSKVRTALQISAKLAVIGCWQAQLAEHEIVVGCEITNVRIVDFDLTLGGLDQYCVINVFNLNI